MKRLILTFLGIALFDYFLFQIEYEKFNEILNIKNIFLFIFASLLVAITNVVFYYRFKIVNVDLLKKKFLVEFLYYRFLSILSFKDIGEIIAKFFILKNIKKINKSKNIFFITYEKVYDLAIPVLLIIPIFGWYLKKIGSISIIRNKVSKDNLSFFGDILRHVNSSDRPIIIFPQGTRLSPEERTPFKKGSSRIYKELNISCQPIAINSGYIWPKLGLKKSNKTLIISILKPIEPGLDKLTFLTKLQNDIYSELDNLN